jgi:hypothetical protein
MKNATDYAAFVALDWGDEHHAFAWRLADTDALEQGSFAASPEALHEWFEQLRRRCDGRPVAVVVEAGNPSLLLALLEHRWLKLYPIHPATSARFRTAFCPSGAKDDGPDARLLLSLLCQHRDRLSPLVLDTPGTRELDALVRLRRAAVDRRTGLTNTLGRVLKDYFPQALVLAGTDLAAPLARAFLRRFPELTTVQKCRPATLRTFYHQHHVRADSCIEERLTLVRLARPLHTDRALIEPAKLEVALLLDQLEVLTRHIAQLEQRVATAFAAHPQASFFAALPGAGPALAPRLLVAFGDHAERYPDASALQKYAGVAPVREKSGHHVWTHWRWNAPTFLRQSFVEWAGQTVVRSPWAGAFYRQQLHAGKTHHAILRALAFKWIRILWRCARDQTTYDEARYLQALHRKNSPLLAWLDQPLSP